jgi:hypothetical protein
MLLVFGAPCQLPSLAGQEHGRTIPLADMGGEISVQRSMRDVWQAELRGIDWPRLNIRTDESRSAMVQAVWLLDWGLT